jgi:hypothetical protein
MKKVALPLALALTLALPASAAWALPNSLLYLFDGSSAGSPGPTLTLHNGVTTTGNGVGHGAEVPGDRALTLDGEDDYAEGQDSTFQPGSGGDFSVSLWAKSTGWGFSWQPLAFMDDDDYGTYSWAVYGTTAGSGTVHAYVRIRDGATLDTLDLHGTGTTLSDGAWHNLALSVDGNAATLYFDGAEIDDATSTLAGGTVNPDADHLFVGGDLYYSSEKFRGFIDVLRYFDSAIGAHDAVTLHNPAA